MNYFLFSQRVILAHQDAPYINSGEFDTVVFFQVPMAHHNAEIQQSFLQAFSHIKSIAAEQMELYLGIRYAELLCSMSQKPYCIAFTAANIDITRNCVIGGCQFAGRFFHQLKNLAGPLLQQSSLLRQCDPSAPTDKQRLSQLLFQIH